MSVYYIASLKINYFIAQNLGNKAKPRDYDPPGYFRSQKYPGYEVDMGIGIWHKPAPSAKRQPAVTADGFDWWDSKF